jgi:polyisoprenoid-binding protein YceI
MTSTDTASTTEAPAAVITHTFEGLTVPTAATFRLDASHSEVGFGVKHMMVSKVRGRFGKYEGAIVVADNPLESTVEFSVDMASIDTREENRDNHLRSGDFFEIELHPTMTFKSSKIEHKGGERFAVTGDLTLKGVTKPITLDLTFEGVVTDPYGNQRIGFTGRGELDRYDYGVTYNAAMEAGGFMVGKKISLELELEAVREA